MIESDGRVKAGNTMRRVLFIAWHVVAAALVAWLLVYVAIGAGVNGYKALFFFALIAFMLIVLFYAEGSEIAVASLADKDPEQIPEPSVKRTVELFVGEHANVESQLDAAAGFARHRWFISGRQLIVVLAVVLLSYLCRNVGEMSIQLSTAVEPSEHGPLMQRLLANDPAVELFSIVFPTLIALWYAQLLSKFIATDSPLMCFGSPLTQLVIYSSLWLGRTLELAAPAELILRLRRASRLPEYQLKPSRAKYYVTTAMLKDGKGLEDGLVEIRVAADGSIDVTETFKYRVYSTGWNKQRHAVATSSLILGEGTSLEILACPEACRPPNPIKPRFDDADTLKRFRPDMHCVEWEVQFGNDLPVGEVLEYRVRWRGDKDSMKFRAGEEDRIGYRFSDAPVRRFTVKVLPERGASFRFIKRPEFAEVEASDNREVNYRERDRIEVTHDNPVGGVTFKIDYPVVGGKYTFFYKIA